MVGPQQIPMRMREWSGTNDAGPSTRLPPWADNRHPSFSTALARTRLLGISSPTTTTRGGSRLCLAGSYVRFGRVCSVGSSSTYAPVKVPVVHDSVFGRPAFK